MIEFSMKNFALTLKWSRKYSFIKVMKNIFLQANEGNIFGRKLFRRNKSGNNRTKRCVKIR